MRRTLRDVCLATIRSLDARAAVRSLLRAQHPKPEEQRLLVLAFGKAARAMAEGLLAAGPFAAVRGLVVPPEPDAAELPPFEVLPGGHPLPTAGSQRAAVRALELAHSVQADETAVFLVSGGGSAMLELPGDPAVGLAELRTLYGALVGCGADIVAINTVRRHLSAVKGGRLLLAAANARSLHTVMVADVPLGSSGTLASGPSEPEPTTLGACRDVLDRFSLWPAVPPALRARLDRGDLLPALPPDSNLLQRCQVSVALDPRHADHWLAHHARRAGLLVVADATVDDQPCERAAAHLLARLERLHRRHPGRAVAVVTTGELSVPLPPDPGTGGRNQQFALACARAIRGRPITVLSCGSDGIDGNSPAAGAVVDGTTMARARRLGFDGHAHLRRCDAFPLLHALGDTIVTGPTGTNVRDLRILVHGG